MVMSRAPSIRYCGDHWFDYGQERELEERPKTSTPHVTLEDMNVCHEREHSIASGMSDSMGTPSTAGTCWLTCFSCMTHVTVSGPPDTIFMPYANLAGLHATKCDAQARRDATLNAAENLN